uniref:Cystatin kininogen-type domain-containing protein n=1 Tax=Gasterosteus aculeatus aculeatus TaxID=481459 RepID=G3NS23_GASAC
MCLSACHHLSQDSHPRFLQIIQWSIPAWRGVTSLLFKSGRIDSRPPPTEPQSRDKRPPGSDHDEQSGGVRVGPAMPSQRGLWADCMCSRAASRLGVLIFCDDPSVQQAVSSAVSKFNERLSTGHKLALFQTLSASKSENGSDSVYSLQFTSRRSNCPAESATPWTDCDYLPLGPEKPISCNATVYMTETEADTKQVDCQLEDVIIRDRARCLGCPVEIAENSEDLKLPLSVSISKYNSQSDSTHLFTLHSVGYSTRQVVAGFRFKLRFDMKKTTCTKTEHKDLNDLCVPDEENTEYANCNSTVDVAPWRFEVPNAHLDCADGKLPLILTRRRPAGWSPLRNILESAPPTASSPSSPPPATASHKASDKAPDKEESSEEDSTASKPPASPAVAADAVHDGPFHCPSKPWKPFTLVHPEAPTKAATEEATSPPSADGAFSDTDLLA